jgi:MoaA/NifB/PqqE/SkfB family radical SAM enzyme
MKPLPVISLAPDETAEDHPLPSYLATAAPVRFAEGFHHEEVAEGLPFRWMSRAGRVHWDAADQPRFLELWLHSHFHDGSQRVAFAVEGGAVEEHGLVRGWNRLSITIPPGAPAARLALNKAFPREYYPGDGRELAVQVRSASVHADAARHEHVARQHANGIRNLKELLEGRVVLESTPPKLGIDIQGACNVKPPCVYCAWDFSKQREGANVEVPFTRETLGTWGDFFENSHELVNCSIGEPFMGRNMDELLDAFGDRGKILEMTTNGQILTEANIRRLLGRNVHLYISLDAATAETYARLRNPRWDQVLENVRRLVAAKGGPGHLPLIYLVFMPMRANVHEVDTFVGLCKELRVDRLVLRPLNDSEGLDLQWDRSGYRFEYQKEILPWEQLVRISGRVAELCRRLGVELSDQLDFGGSMEAQFAEAYAAGRREAEALLEAATRPAQPVSAPGAAASPLPRAAGPEPAPARPIEPPKAPPSLGAERLPACIEPWTSLYILRRGLRPCCYGGQSIGDMTEHAQAWNSPLVQEIRRDLLAGTFHRYCFDSPDCPIVKKAHEARSLSTREEAHRWLRRTWDRVKRNGGGRPGRIYRQAKAYWLTGTGRLRRLVGR